MQRFLETQLLMKAAQIATKIVKKLKNKFILKGLETYLKCIRIIKKYGLGK